MKALLFCPGGGESWIKNYFPEYPIYLLPFANKPAIEYSLDFCIVRGIREVRIVTDGSSTDLRTMFRAGESTGLSLSYSGTASGTPMREIVARNRAFCKGDDLLILAGMFLPSYDKREPHPLEIGVDEIRGRTYGDGLTSWYLIGRERLNALPDDWSKYADDGPVTGEPVFGIRDYYRHNIRLAGSDIEKYNLPGFSEGKNSFVGRDVSIPRSSRVKPPVVLGNSIQFGRNTWIGPDVIIGDNCVIDNDTTVRNAIILGNTYIGRNMEIRGKICYHNHLIDPNREIRIDIPEKFLMSELEPNEYESCPVRQRLLAFLLLLFQTLPFLLLRPFVEIHATLTECFVGHGKKKVLPIHRYATPRDSWAGRLYQKFTLDRFHLLPYAAVGKIRLVGSRLMETNDDNRRIIEGLPGYAPGLFSYSEYLGHDNETSQRELDELYYVYSMNFWFNIKILKGILLHNLQTGIPAPQQRGAIP